MKTVKDVSKLTGISVRTLHYYDEIGLLKPTKISEAGYRLYDDQALKELRQILFFKEFEMPLKEIKVLMKSPEFERKQLLNSQRKILVLRKERLERIIASIDDILEGEDKMDFEVFSKADIEQLYSAIIENMSKEQKDVLIRQYGSVEQFGEQFVQNAAGETAQKNFSRVLDWYGTKEDAMSVMLNPYNSEMTEKCSKRYDAAIKKLAAMVDTDVHSCEVREVMKALDSAAKQLYRMKDMSAFMLELADKYRNDKDMQVRLDQTYGEGSTVYIGRALEAFYNH